VALFDYDNDGDLDVYLGQGGMLGPGKTLADALLPPREGTDLRDQLFRNDLAVAADGRRTVRFTNVTAESGLDARGYSMGVAAADYDNDGDVDLYVTNYGSNQLWRNNGDGTFSDVTAVAGVDDPRWSVSAAFVDIDGDGWLDLYVGNYVDFTFSNQKRCFGKSKQFTYCGPLVHDPAPDSLFRNRGDGSFEPYASRAGIGPPWGAALGVVGADFNLDGRTDLYVANDGTQNRMWINQGDGHFRDEGLLAGVAVNMEGAAEASMGVDVADFDGDGDDDIFLTHLTQETNTLYVNDGKGWFEDRTAVSGLGAPSFPYTGFGTAWIDYDNDGWLDLLAANGAVTLIDELVRAGDPYPLHQPNQLFHNEGGGRLREVAADEAGEVFRLSEVSRGAAFGDIDNDGDTDVVIANNNGPARLLLNQHGNSAHWVGLRLVDRRGRDAVGARVRVRAGALDLWRRVRMDGSYAAANDARVLVGLDGNSGPVDVTVYWPGGAVERWVSQTAGAYHVLHEGQGSEAGPAG